MWCTGAAIAELIVAGLRRAHAPLWRAPALTAGAISSSVSGGGGGVIIRGGGGKRGNGGGGRRPDVLTPTKATIEGHTAGATDDLGWGPAWLDSDAQRQQQRAASRARHAVNALGVLLAVLFGAISLTGVIDVITMSERVTAIVG